MRSGNDNLTGVLGTHHANRVGANHVWLAGDEVCVLFGGVPARVAWVGYRSVDCLHHPEPRLVWPVRIRQGTFGKGLPQRDLMLSPDHAVYADGVLIPVKYLINGTSIVQTPVDTVTYYHIELERHDVVFAEGLPTESYLDTGNRANFANGGEVMRLFPDFANHGLNAPYVWEALGCARLVVTGAELARVRRKIARRGRTKRWHAVGAARLRSRGSGGG